MTATDIYLLPAKRVMSPKAGASTPLTDGSKCLLEKVGGVKNRKLKEKLPKNAWHRLRQFCVQQLHFFTARFARRLFLPSLMNLFRHPYLPLLFKLHAPNLVS